jgi:hypothetical protein
VNGLITALIRNLSSGQLTLEKEEIIVEKSLLSSDGSDFLSKFDLPPSIRILVVNAGPHLRLFSALNAY